MPSLEWFNSTTIFIILNGIPSRTEVFVWKVLRESQIDPEEGSKMISSFHFYMVEKVSGRF